MRYVLFAVATLGAQLTENLAVAEDRPVEFELLIGSDAPLEAAHDWLNVLKQLKVDRIRARSQQAGDNAPSIEGMAAGSKRVKVTAVLTSANRLVVPKASFRRSESKRLSDWIAELRNDPGTSTDSKTEGASASQLLRLRQLMSKKLDYSTNGIDIDEFLSNARADWEVPISIDQSMRNRLDGKMAVELSGLSRGTALAIAVRNYGGTLQPNPDGHSVIITRAGSSDQAWPIGWRLTEPISEVVPKLMDKLNIEVKDIPLADVLNALQAKVDIPFVFDHIELKRNHISIEKIKITIRPIRATYNKVLGGILAKHRLSGEVRIDEAGTPFYWITTLKRNSR